MIAESIRLTFVFNGDEIALRSAKKIPMRAPTGTDNAVPFEDRNTRGKWIEIRDKKGKPVYRRVCHRFIPRDVEVHFANPDTVSRRIPISLKEGLFHMVIPALEGASEAILCEQIQQTGKSKKPRLIEHIKVDLREIDKNQSENKGGK